MVAYIAAVQAKNNPRVLLNVRWNKKVGKIYSSLIAGQIIIYLNVILLDLYGFILDKAIPNFFNPFQRNTEDEKTIDILCRLSQAMVAMMLVCFGYYFLKFYRQSRARQTEASKITKKLNKQKVKTWKGLKQGANPPDCLDCPICLVDWEDEDEIIQLSCHKNHIFHRECFTKFIAGVLKDKVGSPKCPLCQQEVKFN
jgi:hypothetical protein